MTDRFIRRGVVSSVLVSACVVAAAAPVAKKPSNFCAKAAITCPDPFFVGAVTASSARVWARTSEATSVSLRFAKSVKPDAWTTLAPVQATVAGDFTARFQLGGLVGNTNYVYQVGVQQPDGTLAWSPSAWFTSARTAASSLTFSVLADFSNKLVGSPALRKATETPNDFVLFLGDMDHRNPGQDKDGLLPPGDPGVLASMRQMHRDLRNPSSDIGSDVYDGLIASSATRPQTPFYYAWDDHDYCANYVGLNCPNRDAAFQAYRENYLWSADTGLDAPAGCESDSQRLSYGSLADVFVLDVRSNRVDAVTMLGACQMNWLLQGLRTSTATWKFVMSPVPFNATSKTYDAWGHFPADRASLLDAIKASQVHNVVIMSGDIHSGGAYDDGTHSGAPEFSVPHANMPPTWVNTYCRPEYPNQTRFLDIADDSR